MEELLIKLGLNIYQVAGIIGVLIFFIAILIFLLLTGYARRVSSQQKEIETARVETKRAQDEAKLQLKELLDDCENKCTEKDKEIQTYRNNEQWFRNELHNAENQIRELKRELQEISGRLNRRRGNTA